MKSSSALCFRKLECLDKLIVHIEALSSDSITRIFTLFWAIHEQNRELLADVFSVCHHRIAASHYDRAEIAYSQISALRKTKHAQ